MSNKRKKSLAQLLLDKNLICRKTYCGQRGSFNGTRFNKKLLPNQQATSADSGAVAAE